MRGFELEVRPILEKMGVFDGKEISAKEAFENYLNSYPSGIGPLGKFRVIVERKLGLASRKVSDGDSIDYMFSYSYDREKENNKAFHNYDPRVK